MKFANAVRWLTCVVLISALATMLAVNVDPPVIKEERRTSVSGNKVQRIPVPAATPQGGVGPNTSGQAWRRSGARQSSAGRPLAAVPQSVQPERNRRRESCE